MRDRPLRFGLAFAAQAVWVSVVLAPVVALNAVPAAALAAARPVLSDVLGPAIWAFGLALEAAADAQKSRWARDRRRKLHDEPFLASGLFSVWCVVARPPWLALCAARPLTRAPPPAASPTTSAR